MENILGRAEKVGKIIKKYHDLGSKLMSARAFWWPPRSMCGGGANRGPICVRRAFRSAIALFGGLFGEGESPAGERNRAGGGTPYLA